LDSESFGVQHKRRRYRRWEAFAKIVKRLREGGPCYPRDIYNDPEMDLGRSTVNHDFKLGVLQGVFKKLEDDRYAWIDDKIPSETTTLWQPQSGEVTFCIEGLEAKDNPERHKANLPVLKTILHSGQWVKELDDFLCKALNNPEEYEEVIDRLLHAVPRNRENIELFFKSKRDKIYDLIKSSDRLGSKALSISVDISEGKEVLVWMEEALEGEEAERVLKAALGYGGKLYEKFNFDFKKFLQKALGHENEKVKQYASILISEIYYT